MPVSVVGGAVRDALLGRPHGPDIDLVVEGDALAVAERLGRALSAFVVAHERFGTARLELPHGTEIDVVTARRERYPAPGALPEVEPGTLADDLARRDFTINAMAYRATGPGAGEIVDPHGGRADLAAGLVRALRDDAFPEDPSRIVRAARYAARLGFALDDGTRRQAASEAARLALSSFRVAEELERALSEDSAARALILLRELGVPWIADGDLPSRFAALDGALGLPGAPALPAWPLRLGVAVAPEAVAGSLVPGWARGLAAEVREGPDIATRLDDGMPPSRVDALLAGRPAAAAVGAAAAGSPQVTRWWAEWRDARLAIGGSDLVAAGVRPGPAVGHGLRVARAALLDGRAPDRATQLAVALGAAA